MAGLSYSYLVAPVLALVAVGVLALLLRWTFGRGSSLVERRARAGNPEEYGLLEPVANPATYVEGEFLRQSLREAGIQATLAQTALGPRLMVWPNDHKDAKVVLRQLGREVL